MKIDQRSPLLEVGRELRRISGPAEPKSAAIGMEGQRAEIRAYQAPVDLDPSPALSLVGKAKPVLKGRKIGALVTDEADADRLQALRDALEREGAELAIVAPKIGGALSRRLRTCDLLGGSIARWMKKIDYDGYRFPPAIIQQAIWLYFRFTSSFRDLEDLLAERGIPRWEKAVRDLHRSGDRGND